MEIPNVIYPTYNPSDKEKEARKWVYDAFDIMWDNNNKAYEQFGNKQLRTYIDNSRSSINIMNVPREDRRSNIKSVTPLNKLLAVLARVAMQRPTIKVLAQNRKELVDKIRSNVIEDLYKWSYVNIQNETDADIDYFFKAFDNVIDGTYIDYEGFDNQEHTHKKITKYDPTTGDVEFTEEKFKSNSCYSQQVKLTDFFVWNPYMRSLQKQPKVCWRSLIDESTFEYEFKGFKNYKYVKAGTFYKPDGEEDKYQKSWSTRTNDKKIEILRMFGSEDRMVVIANGIILQDTPMVFENGKPKKYPFSKTIRIPFAGGEFFWGMSWWHLLEGDVSALEALHNLGLEQAKISVNPPTLTTAENDMEDNNLAAGRVLEVDDINNFRELQFKSPDQSYFNFLEVIGKNIDFSTVDPASQGHNVANVTARGQVIAEENARKLLSNLTMMMENLVLQEAKLRIPNIIQFQFLPATQFRIENTNIGGQSGVRDIKVLEKTSQDMAMMSEEEREIIEKESDMIEKMAVLHGITLERLVVSFDFLTDIKYNIYVEKDSSFQQSKSIEKAQYMERLGTTAQLFPEIFNGAKDLFFKDMYEMYGEDPNKFLEAVNKSGRTDELINKIQGMMGGGQGGTRLQSDLKGENLAKLSEVE